MKLLVIRHAIAEDKGNWAGTGASDDSRPLTEDGEGKMVRNASGLHSIISRIDLLATSPLTRARQTADIVAAEFGIGDVETTDALAPDRPPKELARWAGAHGEKELIAIVGHEPHLSGLVTWFMVGSSSAAVELKKGGACLLEFEKAPSSGGGILEWLLTPAQLRRLGGK